MSNESSSNKLLLRNKVDKEKVKNFDLSKHLVNLMFAEPFYTRIYRSMNKVETEAISTAGVTVIDNNLTLYWNREFLASLENKKVMGLLKHEALHFVFDHITKRRKDPHLIWNYSTDLAINSTIPYDELPKGGLVPGRKLPELTKEELANFDQENIQRYKKISNLIQSLPSNKTSEFYYNKLIENEEMKSMSEEGERNSLNLGFDDHGSWDDISEDTKDHIKAKIEDIIKNATKECENKGWGTVPVELRKELIKRFSNTINWSSLLKRFCGFARSEDRRSSIRRLNRKYTGIHPGVNKSYRPKIAIYVDESGSMSESSLSLLYGELENLSKQTEFFLYRFDAIVHEKSMIKWKKGRRLNIERKYSGGTCFNSVSKHAIKNKSKYDAYIVMTDGCAPKPIVSHGIKRAWIIIPNCDLTFEADKKDVVIKMKH